MNYLDRRDLTFWLRVVLAAAAVAIGIVIWPHAFAPIWGTALERTLFVGIAWASIACGLVAWARRPENRTGVALVATGFVFWCPTLIGIRVPLLWTVGSTFEILFVPVLFYALLVFPQGRIRYRAERALVVWVSIVFVFSLVGSPFYDPADFGCADCQSGLNLLLIRSDPSIVLSLGQTLGWLLILSLAGLLFVLGARWWRATLPARRVMAPLVLPALGWALSYLAYLGFQQSAQHTIYAPPEIVYRTLATTMLVSLFFMPMTFLMGFARYRARRARVGDLIVELGDIPTPERLQVALSKTLGDPSLVVGIWAPDDEHYMAPGGAVVTPPRDDDETRVATRLERHGEPLAVIVHDRALLDDPGLVVSVTAAARLAVENEKLQAEVLKQLAHVHESRARIVESSDRERKRIERNLHDGAQQRLVSLSLALQVAQKELDGAPPGARQSLMDASRELDRALSELRELARGTYPAVLTEAGLGPALESLADRAAVPVELDIAQLADARLTEKVEATAYFVISEALTNVAKYGHASRARVCATAERGTLLIEVADDGVGGADPSLGSGLAGLRDRVQALDGDLTVDSPLGKGTRIAARVPCE